MEPETPQPGQPGQPGNLPGAAPSAHGAALASAHLQQPSEIVLLLSFDQRDTLADQISAAGFRVVAARRGQGIARRFRGLASALVVIDARNALDQARLAAQALSTPGSSEPANILLLYDRKDAEHLSAFAELGISAMLPAPWHPAELALALALARRQGRSHAAIQRPHGQLWWQGDTATGQITVESDSDGLARRFYADCAQNLGRALRHMSPSDRRRAMAAFRKLRAHGGYAAFAQVNLPGDAHGQMIHHLLLSGQRIAGHVEWIDHRSDAEPGAAPGTDFMPFDQALALAATLSPDPPEGPMVTLFRIDGIEAYCSRAGAAAGEALIIRFARQLNRALRQDLGIHWLACGVDSNRFALIALDESHGDALALTIRMIGSTTAEAQLYPADEGLQLRMAHASAKRGESPAALLGRLNRRLAVPQARVMQLDVPTAMALGQIAVRFQPQFAMADDGLTGAEVLARWHHPVFGDLGGSTLFSAARATGMERALSQHVWNQAMLAQAQWPARLDSLRLAINVTASDMADPALAADILHIAARNHISPDRLTVEITESAAIASPDQAAANLSALRRAGVKVALDDFGTGYSGLAWLKQLPVDYIKIDSGFSRDATGPAHDRAVLQGVVDLARRLGMDVLAEGVEDSDQRDRLAAMGCRWYQGYLRAPAMTGAAFLDFVADLARDAGQPL